MHAYPIISFNNVFIKILIIEIFISIPTIKP